jgi:hypothetical protein
MLNSLRYRYNAAECLRAAHEARQPIVRKLRLSMALSWLSLAHRDEASEVARNAEPSVESGASPARPFSMADGLTGRP